MVPWPCEWVHVCEGTVANALLVLLCMYDVPCCVSRGACLYSNAPACLPTILPNHKNCKAYTNPVSVSRVAS